jgi:tetratricopeptide (TPR) repeat protein
MSRHLARRLLSGAIAAMLVGIALPAAAQTAGTAGLRGKVLDETGKPVDKADVVLDYVGDLKQQYKVTTNKNGEWIKTGMIATPGTWNITVTFGKKVGRLNGVTNKIGEMKTLADISVSENAGSTAKPPAGMSNEEIAKKNKRQAELEALFNSTNASFDAGQYDDAIVKLQEIIKEMEKCAPCYAKLGDAYIKKNDLKQAEAAYLKSIEFDDKAHGPYAALASIYNEQKKYDEATKMSAKATELQTASGGSVDPTALFNQGVIYWNQGKYAEAKAEWEKAVKLDPKMADAQYWLGMAAINQGKIPEAKTAFNEYLKLAPTGQYAATVKAILDTIK